MKIIIIGAGIAGLTFARACHLAGFEVKIYEKTKKLTNIGGGILIWPHGMRCLHQLDLADKLLSYKTSIETCNIYNSTGDKIFSENLSVLSQALGGDIFPIDRYLLQHVLAHSIPETSLTLDKTCASIVNHSNHAQVFFSDGTQDSADLIVGADGIHSCVSQAILEKTSPIYTNFCWWGGIVERKYVPDFLPNETQTILGKGKVCVIWPTFDDKLMWYIPVKMPAENLIRHGDGITQLKSLCEDWNKNVTEIISAPHTHQHFHLSIYTLPPKKQWSSERVTLIGDAAHAIGPILAQGASLAIEDGYILSKCLLNFNSNIPAAIQHFEQMRYHRYQRIYDLENQAANMMITDDTEALDMLQQQLPNLNLLNLYQDLIPLVREDIESQCVPEVIF